MPAQVIPFPAGRRPVPVPARAASAVLAPSLAHEPATDPVAELSLELRRVVHAGTPITPQIQAGLQERSVRAALRALSRFDANLRVAGTEEHPILEATFEAGGASVDAARAALDADEAIRRASGREFVAAGAVAAGSAAEGAGGVRVVMGAPVSVAARLRENAAPGQVLLGGGLWAESTCVDVRPAQNLVLVPGASGVPVFVLRDVR